MNPQTPDELAPGQATLKVRRDRWFLKPERLLMLVIVCMQVVLLALYVRDRRQHGTLDATPPPKTPNPNPSVLSSSSSRLDDGALHQQAAEAADSAAAIMDARVAHLQNDMNQRLQRMLQFSDEFPVDLHASQQQALGRQMDQMLERAFQDIRLLENSARFDEGWSALMRTPTLDMRDMNTHYLVLCSLPGLDESGINVTLEGRLLTIAGPASSTARRPFHLVQFERRVWLPGPVGIAEDARAFLTNGVLHVEIPKGELEEAQVANARRLL